MKWAIVGHRTHDVMVESPDIIALAEADFGSLVVNNSGHLRIYGGNNAFKGSEWSMNMFNNLPTPYKEMDLVVWRLVPDDYEDTPGVGKLMPLNKYHSEQLPLP